MNNNSKESKRKLSGFTAELYEWLEAIAFALAIVVILFTFVFRVVSVQGTSMEDTLSENDRLVVSCLFYTPEVGDVIIISGYGDTENHTTVSSSESIVKRVIATGGDYVRIDSNGTVFVGSDPNAMTESAYNNCGFTDPSNFRALPCYNAEGDYVYVEEGCVFVLGDHREVSIDSRKFGLIKNDSIIGKVQLRIFPFDSFSTIK